MPGAFAHITAANLAFAGTNSLDQIAIPNSARLILSQNIKFTELGCVSPDYPYLVLGNSVQNKWADLMHYEHTGELIKELARRCKEMNGKPQEKVFAWLCGYISHVIADITIHPVVEMKVGEYEQNQSDHRTCEMNQDTYIWKRLNLGQIGVADRVKLNIGDCVDRSGDIDPDIQSIWEAGLLEVHPSYAREAPPQMSDWHNGFQRVVDNAEEGYRRLFKWARHVSAALGAGIAYPTPEELEMTYIEDLDTPKGKMHYDDIFDLAVSNIQQYVGYLGRYVFSDGSLDEFKNWNLDNGKDEHQELTAWL
ncbi:Zinc dependent phospholipase C [Pseudidiomarina planktonica]|uniref:Zinc dependent phospholipase C n=1 Tax=Pseudidiomarina planktonica TaxID=1323738 RepID=A0A1Y6E9W5_9GAMM|nr:zinc dependent phospholipase C family protein [Pseudidiomarina planktonica]RUO66250.1 hypothetical protein CWI77_07465 [Pseudidiomarina planktonica]SMQ59385.1 Zinc dependent phospholipase C [Pseudidiomarina planktonica]